MKTLALALAALLPLACGGKEKPAAPASAAPPAEASGLSSFALKESPGEAVSVLEAKGGEDGDEVVVEGRLKNIVRGFASFQLMDASLDYCGSGDDPMDDCSTPWDYCCIANDVQTGHMLVVEADGPDGKVLRTGTIPGLRLLDLLVVKGRVSKDEHGNVTIHASGWYMKERPELREGLRWPN